MNCSVICQFQFISLNRKIHFSSETLVIEDLWQYRRISEPFRLTNVRFDDYNTYAMKVTASKLRENVYRILDQVLESGTPIEIKRKGRTLKIVREDSPQKTSRLIKRKIIQGRPQELIHLDWSEEWKPE